MNNMNPSNDDVKTGNTGHDILLGGLSGSKRAFTFHRLPTGLVPMSKTAREMSTVTSFGNSNCPSCVYGN